jgi:hypothetical protein
MSPAVRRFAASFRAVQTRRWARGVLDARLRAVTGGARSQRHSERSTGQPRRSAVGSILQPASGGEVSQNPFASGPDAERRIGATRKRSGRPGPDTPALAVLVFFRPVSILSLARPSRPTRIGLLPAQTTTCHICCCCLPAWASASPWLGQLPCFAT